VAMNPMAQFEVSRSYRCISADTSVVSNQRCGCSSSQARLAVFLRGCHAQRASCPRACSRWRNILRIRLRHDHFRAAEAGLQFFPLIYIFTFVCFQRPRSHPGSFTVTTTSRSTFALARSGPDRDRHGLFKHGIGFLSSWCQAAIYCCSCWYQSRSCRSSTRAPFSLSVRLFAHACRTHHAESLRAFVIALGGLW